MEVLINNELLKSSDFYNCESIPQVVRNFSTVINTQKELLERANILKMYINYLDDVIFKEKLVSVARKLCNEIRINPKFANVHFDLSGRYKSFASVDDKTTDKQMKNDGGSPLMDICGFRFVVDNKNEAEAVEELTNLMVFCIKKLREFGFEPVTARPPKETEGFDPSQVANIYVPPRSLVPEEIQLYVKDYVTHPKKKRGYQAYHVVFLNQEYAKFVEFQFRTLQQHFRAEYLEGAHELFKATKLSKKAKNEPDGSPLKTEAIMLENVAMVGFTAQKVKNNYCVKDNIGLITPIDIFKP